MFKKPGRNVLVAVCLVVVVVVGGSLLVLRRNEGDQQSSSAPRALSSQKSDSSLRPGNNGQVAGAAHPDGSGQPDANGERQPQPAPSCVPRNDDSYYRTDRSFIVDPKNPRHMFVAVEYKGAYQTYDGGKTWAPTLGGFRWRNGCFPEPFKALFSPTDSNVIYLSVNGDGIVRTRDGGRTWKKIYQDWMYNRSEDFQFDPTDDQIIYAATEDIKGAPNPLDNSPVTKGLVYKTVDGGNIWTELPTGLVEGAGNNGIVVSNNDPKRILAFTLVVHFHPDGRQIDTSNQLGILTSTDGGTSWQTAHLLPAAYEATAFVATAPVNHNNIFVTSFTAPGVSEQDYSTLDFAHTWRRSDTVLATVAYDPHDAHGLHMLGINQQPNVNLHHKIYESTDGGKTWAANLNLPSQVADVASHRTLISTIAWDPSDPHTLYASAASSYAWRSTDSGQSWQTLLDLSSLPG